MSSPPISSLSPSGVFTTEEALDVLAYILSVVPGPCGGVSWILGSVGMGNPAQLPFGYITPSNENILWETANGGRGGLSAGGTQGLDDWAGIVTLTVAYARHDYEPPVQAVPPAGSPVSAAALGIQPPFQEQPGYRLSLQLAESIKATLRLYITAQGELATSRVSTVQWTMIPIDNQLYRALVLTVQTQQRRPRGD